MRQLLFNVMLLTLSSLILSISSYTYNSGYIFISEYNSTVEKTFNCNYASFSPLQNTTAMPILNFGLGCNKSNVWDTAMKLTTSVPEFIALIQRGDCLFTEKSQYAIQLNAKGLIIYNYNGVDTNFYMGSNGEYSTPIPVVSISGVDGDWIVQELNADNRHIIAEIIANTHNRPNTDELSFIAFIVFVILVFIVLIIVLIALMLTIYQLTCKCYSLYREKRRSEASQREMNRRLNEIPCKPYSMPSDATSLDGVHDSCAVCLEEYKAGDMIRLLPCSHPFHKDCVDPWLLSKYTCPLCKFNVLTKQPADIESIGLTNNQTIAPVINDETTASVNEIRINRSDDEHSDSESVSLKSSSSQERLLIV